MTVHQQILDAIQVYETEHSKFQDKGIKASAARARAALGDLAKLAKVRRDEIQTKKNEMAIKK